MSNHRLRPDSDVLLGLDNSLLRTLMAVVDTGSFVGAARTVHRTPSAISMQMKRLETQIGQPIFVHQRRSVMLTPAGETLLTYARRALGIAEEAIMRFNRLSPGSAVRLGMTDEYAVAFLPSVLASYTAAHPLVEISVTCRTSSTMSRMLDEGELDVALVTAGVTNRSGSPDTVIHRDRLVWAGLAHGTAHLSRPLAIAAGPTTCIWRKSAIDALDAAGISYHIVCTSENLAGQLALVVAGLAVAPLPIAALSGELTPFGPEQGLPSIGYYDVALRRSPHAPHDPTSTVVDHVGAYFAARQSF
ncbi:LysR substrate-binding domain-containing protein [Mesorhizobium sp. M0145]|uniref:LysR family transcriptional regulator n=1 Tax=Mesorhizobium sp. M0145 TaxID=2956895 RepID=UPI0033370725